MAKRFDSPLHLGDQVRSIVAAQLRRAIVDLERIDVDAAETVHGVRTTCKRVRGVARLVRPGLGDHYGWVNAGCRDAARSLSPLRDQHALLETFDALVAAAGRRVPSPGLAAVRAALVDDAAAATEVVTPGDPRVLEAAALLRAVADDVERWPEVDLVDAVDGMTRTYDRGRRALEVVIDAPSPEASHEWRKRVKYLWYQVQTVRDAAPSILRPLAVGLHELSGALGDEHDLAVLAERIDAEVERFGPDHEREAVRRLADSRGADLRARALSRGRRLYVETPRAFADRICGYLVVWEESGRERRVGEIAQLVPPGDGFDGLSTTALRREARRRGVPGRTVLSRAELVAALRVHPRRPV